MFFAEKSLSSTTASSLRSAAVLPSTTFSVHKQHRQKRSVVAFNGCGFFYIVADALKVFAGSKGTFFKPVSLYPVEHIGCFHKRRRLSFPLKVQHIQRFIHMKRPPVMVSVLPVVIVEPVGTVGILLDLTEQDPASHRVDTSGWNENRIARTDGKLP